MQAWSSTRRRGSILRRNAQNYSTVIPNDITRGGAVSYAVISSDGMSTSTIPVENVRETTAVIEAKQGAIIAARVTLKSDKGDVEALVPIDDIVDGKVVATVDSDGAVAVKNGRLRPAGRSATTTTAILSATFTLSILVCVNFLLLLAGAYRQLAYRIGERRDREPARVFS